MLTYKIPLRRGRVFLKCWGFAFKAACYWAIRTVTEPPSMGIQDRVQLSELGCMNYVCTFVQVYFHPVFLYLGCWHSSDERADSLGLMENNPFGLYSGSHLNPCSIILHLCCKSWGGSKRRYLTVLSPPSRWPSCTTYARGVFETTFECGH